MGAMLLAGYRGDMNRTAKHIYYASNACKKYELVTAISVNQMDTPLPAAGDWRQFNQIDSA
jgi:hypothetical protein